MSQLANVNTDDIPEAIRLGCQTMGQVFNRDDDLRPFFGSRVWPDPELAFSPVHSESHVPGRHLNALLHAEDILGSSVPLDEETVHLHAQAAFFSYSGAVPLPLNREFLDGELINLSPHNIREGFHALHALIRFRDSAEATSLAQRSIQTIMEHWSPHTGWDRNYLEGELGLKVRSSSFIAGLARALGPLVKLIRTTRMGDAWELAHLIAQQALQECFPEDGHYDPQVHGYHTHSTTCVMSSLAQLADLTADMPLLQSVKAFYDRGLWEIRNAIGWCIESSHPDASSDRGEVNNSGDILETALILGKYGWSEAYADAERILRCHILPSQLRDVSFMPASPDPAPHDGQRNVAERHLGAFGFPAPYGHAPLGDQSISFNMDIVGGAVSSLCEAWRQATTFEQGRGHQVNLLFDRDTETIKVESPYTQGVLQVTLKQEGPLWIRKPSWVQGEELHLPLGCQVYTNDKGYWFIPHLPVATPMTIRFPLREQELVLQHRTRDIPMRLRGDTPIAMQNHGADLTFFPNMA